MSLDKWNWICKDRTGDVFVFENKPMLDIEEGFWRNSGGDYAHCWRESGKGFSNSLKEIHKYSEDKPIVKDLERELYECRVRNRNLEESNKKVKESWGFLNLYHLRKMLFSEYPDFHEVEECILIGLDHNGYFIDKDGFSWPYCRPTCQDEDKEIKLEPKVIIKKNGETELIAVEESTGRVVSGLTDCKQEFNCDGTSKTTITFWSKGF